MTIPLAVTRFNKRCLNPLIVRLAGRGWFVELEHVGRRSGTVFRTPLMAFRDGDVVTIALTYGPDVDWLKNLRAADGGRMRHAQRLLTLGGPATVPTAEGLRRMPQPVRTMLPRLGCTHFVELPVLADDPVPDATTPCPP